MAPTKEKYVEDTASTVSGEEGDAPPPRREKKSKSSSQALDQIPGVGDVGGTAEGAMSTVSNTLGSVGGGVLGGGQKEQGGESGGGGKSDTLRLRLDLNLDIEIQLKARIHGDLELALLTG